MPSSSELHQFVIDQESAPARRCSPHEAVDAAIKRVEAVAYTKGIADALSRLELLASMVPNRRISAAEIIRMARKECDMVIGEWRKKMNPS